MIDEAVQRTMLSQRFDSAFAFAAKLHKSQVRKGTTIPYLGHLLGVTALVVEDGGSEDEAIAALLHDSIEDQGDQYPGGRDALRVYIREQFGAAVADIVDACTDDEGCAKGLADTPAEERQRWLERKRKYIESIAHKKRRKHSGSWLLTSYTTRNQLSTRMRPSAQNSGVASEPIPLRTKSQHIEIYPQRLPLGTRDSSLMSASVWRSDFHGL